MKRRSLLRTILIGTVAITTYPSYRYYAIIKPPDLSFLQNNKQLLAELAETIIPATDTPGAKAAMVEEYIIKMIFDCAEKSSQNNFIEGLKNLESYCESNYSKSFVTCNSKQKEETLMHFEKAAQRYNGIVGKVQNKLLGKPFFLLLREYTVQGYCTSKLGATQGLAYEFIPGTFEPCVPLKPHQKSWATK